MRLLVSGVCKRFLTRTGDTHALLNVHLDVGSGEFVCLVGPSGCGKTTLLNILAGLDTPDRGDVAVDGRRITGPGPDRIVIFQEPSLFPWIDVRRNVEFGLELRGIPPQERRAISDRYLRMVHLRRYAQSFVHELSGGMRQRVALVRALALDPQILLMDEPFGALDAETQRRLQSELEQIWLETQKTIVFVTHNVVEAVQLGDRIVVFGTRPGRIKREFSVDLPRPRRPEDPRVQRLVTEVRKEFEGEIERVRAQEDLHV